jgi:molybdopterin biosynthesis enzyme MoaB
MAARDVYYEIAAPITDRNLLGSGEVLRQVCIQKLY